MEFLEQASEMSEDDLDFYDMVTRLVTRVAVYTSFYPFYVLATNRMLNTFIQRKTIKDKKDKQVVKRNLKKYVNNLVRFVTMKRMRSDFMDISHSNQRVQEMLKF